MDEILDQISEEVSKFLLDSLDQINKASSELFQLSNSRQCGHCGITSESTEQVKRLDHTDVVLCPDCLWMYENMGWLVDDSRSE